MGNGYTPNMQQYPVADSTSDTPAEERPDLDEALPPPPAISALQDALTGDAVPQGGRAFVRIVSTGGQTDTYDPGA